MGKYWDPIEAEKRNMPLTPNMRRDGTTFHMDTSYQALRKDQRRPGSPFGLDAQHANYLPIFRRLVPAEYRHLAVEHPFGNPPTTLFAGLPVSLSSMEFAYVVFQLSDRLMKARAILEIGGGFGGLTRTLLRENSNVAIDIVDLYPMLRIQEYYLRNTTPESSVVVLWNDIPLNSKYDIAISTRTLCEFDLAETNLYLAQIDDALKPGGVFYCVHHDECINKYRDWDLPDMETWELINDRPFPFQVRKEWREKIWRKK